MCNEKTDTVKRAASGGGIQTYPAAVSAEFRALVLDGLFVRRNPGVHADGEHALRFEPGSQGAAHLLRRLNAVALPNDLQSNAQLTR